MDSAFKLHFSKMVTKLSFQLHSVHLNQFKKLKSNKNCIHFVQMKKIAKQKYDIAIIFIQLSSMKIKEMIFYRIAEKRTNHSQCLWVKKRNFFAIEDTWPVIFCLIPKLQKYGHFSVFHTVKGKNGFGGQS